MSHLFSRRSVVASFAAAGLVQCAPNTPQQADVSSNNDPQISPWTTAISLPQPAQEIYPCHHAGRIHLAGGFIAENGRISGPTDQHVSWAPGEPSWTDDTALPAARHHPQLISFSGALLAIAGFESRSERAAWVMQSSNWAQSEAGDWQVIAALPAPCGEAVTGVTGDGVLHLAGGRTPIGESNAGWRDHGDSYHHFVLTDLAGSWDAAAPCLTKRNSAAGGVIDGNLHIVGGRTAGGGNVASHEVYDHKEDRWRTAAPMPNAQGGLAAAAVSGKLYAFGGEFFDNGGGVYPESWMYDPRTDTWSALSDMPTPRHGLGAVVLDGAIYVIGGAEKASGVDTSAIVEVYTP